MTDFQERLQRALATEFRIDRELGGAGMSRVFMATERALNRTVVVKVLPPELAAGVNVERFRREIQLAAQLQHPHIVPLLATGDHDGLLWFSMPYIEGESLRGVLERRQRLPSREVVRILRDVVDALAYAHARGVVHRDIKPDNVLTSGLHALVTDFGVAKALSAASPTNGGTGTGMAIGTPAYMAPEQLAADPAADHRVDLYAVGLLAYELLTGKGPFAGRSPQATLAAQLTHVPEPPHRSLSDVPEALSQLVMRCLEKDAAQRPQTAAALLADLEAVAFSANGLSLVPYRRRVPPARLAGALIAFAAAGWAVMHRRPAAGDTPATLDARDAGPGGAISPTVRAPNGAASGAPASAARATDTLTTDVDRALLLEELGRVFADSMARAIRHMDSALANAPQVVRLSQAPDTRAAARPPTFVTPLLAPPSDARLRVVVASFTNATGRRELNRLARDAATQLRAALSAERFDVVSTEVTASALRALPDRMSVGWALRADFVVSGWMMQRGDSVAMVTMLTDVRTGRYSRATEHVVAAGATLPVDQAEKQMRVWLDTAAAIAARRRAAEAARR